jgi:hypothetical protein
MSNIASRMEIGKLQGGVSSEIGKGTDFFRGFLRDLG